MLIITDLQGNTEGLTGCKSLKRSRNVAQERSISFTLLPVESNKHSFDMVKEEALIEFDGDMYRIKQLSEKPRGKSKIKTVVAVRTFFDLIGSHQYGLKNGSLTFDAAAQFVLGGTGYTYTILDTFYAKDWENWGDDNRVALFQAMVNRYGAEYTIKDKHITFRRKIGQATDFQFRFNYNIKALNRHVDTKNLSTYIKGYGKKNEDGTYVTEAEYVSPNAALFPNPDSPDGYWHAKPVRDERYTEYAGLLDRLKQEIIDEPEVAITVDFVDMRRAGYPYDVPNEGDDVFLIYEPLGLDIEARIMEIEEEFAEGQPYPIKTNVTIANFRNNIVKQLVDFKQTQKEVGKLLDGSGKLPYSVLDEAVRRATELLLGSATELEYTELGIIARSKLNRNHLVLVSSTGVGVSTDNGVTFRQAITAEGIVADLITVGTMLFNRIRGGTLTLGGPENGNGRMQVLDANGEVIADLDAGNGGFEWLRIGDVISDSVVKTNIKDITFYVDSVNGDDDNNGLTINTKKKTVQNCLDSLPKFNSAIINIVCDNRNIKENIVVTGFTGEGSVIIDLGGSQLDGNLKIMGNMNRVDAKSAVINSANDGYATVFVAKTTQSALTDLKLYCRNETNHGICAVDNTFLQLYNCEVYDTINAIRAGHGAKVYVNDCRGLGEYGIVADYVGTIGGTGTAPAGTVSNTRARYGGEVRNTFTHDSGEKALPTPPPPPAAPDVTKTWSSVSADNYAMGTYGWVNDGYPKQGNYGYGRRKGLWFFGSDIYNTVNGKNIKRVRVYIKRKSSGGSSAKTAIQIRSHTYASKPGGEPSLSNAYKSVSLGWGEGVWVDLPADFITAFKSGGARGIGVYVASDSSSYYALMEAAAKIEITYS